MYIKGNQIEDGYLLKKADGSITLNASKEDWIAEGWEEYIPEPVKEQTLIRNLVSVKQEVLQECNSYYESVILKVEFQGNLIWVPLETRAAYRDILDDLKEAGETQVNWRDTDLTIDSALEALKKVNIYEYNCKKVHDSHLRVITRSQSIKELEEYDYTTDYPSAISI